MSDTKNTKKRIAVFPGAFDPPTLGHLDIVRRGLTIFDEVVVAVARNPGKTALFSVEARVALLREATAGMAGVTVDAYEGLTVDYVRKLGATAILRGLRTPTDLDFEMQLALTNRAISGTETVFVAAGERYGFISSSLIKEVARLGGDVSSMVPEAVVRGLKEKLG